MAVDSGLVRLAIYSRLAVILLQFVGNALIPDHEAGVFNPPVAAADKFTIFDRLIFFVFGGFRRWDAVYYLHIAGHGYTYENCAAFFPLYPMIISAAKLLPLPDSLVSQASVLLLFAVVLNLVIFAATAVTLFHLGNSLLRDKEVALFAAELFCINPASIFMTAPYTETLFAFLSFCGMLCISKNQLYSALCFFSASALTRSNGLVSIGFILYYLLKYVTATCETVKGKSDLRELLRPATDFIIRAGFLSGLVIAPFASFQYYIYGLFCHPEKQHEDIVPEIAEYGRLQGYKLVGDSPPSSWCYAWLPFSYSYIQKQHWGVGFLSYFHMKQIPNFVLATPVAIISFWSCWDYYQKQPRLCQTLGLKKVAGNGQIRGWAHPEVFVYIPHLMFLTVFGCLFMHIQVLTRLLFSASPVLYWFTADRILNQSQDRVSVRLCRKHKDASHWCILKNFQTKFSICTKLTLSYYIIYFVVGTLAFSNFLPWT